MSHRVADLDESMFPTIREMQTFAVLARAQTITEAASTLGISQSQLSRILRGLETRLGVILIERRPTGLRLTPEGEAFSDTCARVGEVLSTQMRRFENRIAGEGGQIRLAVLPSMAFEHLGTWTRAFRDAFPQATITATDDVSGNAVRSLLAGDVDVAISACLLRGPDDRETFLFPEETAALSVDPLLSERFHLIGPSDDEMPADPDWSFAFARATVGFTERTSIQRCLSLIAAEAGTTHSPETLTNSPLTIAGLVEAGMGRSIVPESNLALMRVRNLSTAPLPDYRRVVCAVSHPGDDTPLVRHLLRTLRGITGERVRAS